MCQHITLHSLITFHHANIRGSRLEVFVYQKHFVIHASCLVLCRIPLQSYSHTLLQTQACCLTIHIYLATIHGGVAVPQISNLPQVLSPNGSSSTGILRLNIKIRHETELWEMIITEDMDEFGKVGVKSMSCCQSLIHSDYDSAESIADLETNNYVRCRLHRCVFRSEKETLILLENREFQGNLMQWL